MILTIMGLDNHPEALCSPNAPIAEAEECEHDEHDHGICLDCAADITDDLVGMAEYNWEGLER